MEPKHGFAGLVHAKGFDQRFGVFFILHPEGRTQAELTGFCAQNPGAEAVESVDVHAPCRHRVALKEALSHALSCPVGEGDGQDSRWLDASGDRYGHSL